MIIDIIIVLLFLITCFIGYKIGFLTTLIKIASVISGLVIAIMFTRPLTDGVVKLGWDNGIENNIYNNIISSEAYTKYFDAGGGTEGTKELLTELGLPSFFSGMIATKLASTAAPEEIARSIAENIAYACMIILIFIALLLFSSLVFLLCKLLIKGVRNSIGFIRIVDGILGIFAFTLFFFVLIDIAFILVSVVISSSPENASIAVFFREQLKIGKEGFGIGKYLYEHNVLGNLFNLIF